MKMNKLVTVLFALCILFFTSCEKDDDTILPRGNYENGILISGEGNGAISGSVSFISNDLMTSENLIYQKVNNTELSWYLQSIAFDAKNAYLVVDNQNRVTVVDRYTFEEKGTITTGLVAPRYMAVVGNKGYITNWNTGVFEADVDDDYIAVVNLDTYEVESKIDVAIGPEQIIERNGKLYVSHKGARGTNNIVSVITIADSNIEEITVGFKPDEMFFNNAGELVVLSGGNESWTSNETLASIDRIDVISNTLISSVTFAVGEHPSLMILDNNTIYYGLNNKIYKMDVNATELPSTSILTAEGFLYGMEVGNDNIYTLNANFSDVSTLNVYDLTTIEKTQTISVALGASKVYFN